MCGRDHRAKEKHKREEVSAVIKRLKDKHATGLLTVADLDAVFEMGGEEGDNEEEAHEAQWAEE